MSVSVCKVLSLFLQYKKCVVYVVSTLQVIFALPPHTSIAVYLQLIWRSYLLLCHVTTISSQIFLSGHESQPRPFLIGDIHMCLSVTHTLLLHTVWKVNRLPPKKKKERKKKCPDCPTPGSFTPFLCLCSPICVRIHMVMGVRRWGGSHVQCGTRAFVLKLPPPRPEVKLNSAQIPQWVWPWAGPDWTGARGASCGPLWSQAFWVIEDPDY